MYLSAKNHGFLPIRIEDGNGCTITDCISIETTTGEGLAYLNTSKLQNLPDGWSIAEFVTGSLTAVNARWKTPIRVFSRDSGIEINSEIQLFVVIRFHSLRCKIESIDSRNKSQLETAFINLWAELGRAKAGIR